MRSITIGAMGTTVLAVCAVSLKLFTFEFYLADDPTCGVAMRMSPGLETRRLVKDSSELKNKILLEDENDFRGSTLYRHITTWAWLPLILGAAGLWILRRRPTIPT